MNAGPARGKPHLQLVTQARQEPRQCSVAQFLSYHSGIARRHRDHWTGRRQNNSPAMRVKAHNICVARLREKCHLGT